MLGSGSAQCSAARARVAWRHPCPSLLQSGSRAGNPAQRGAIPAQWRKVLRHGSSATPMPTNHHAMPVPRAMVRQFLMEGWSARRCRASLCSEIKGAGSVLLGGRQRGGKARVRQAKCAASVFSARRASRQRPAAKLRAKAPPGGACVCSCKVRQNALAARHASRQRCVRVPYVRRACVFAGTSRAPARRRTPAYHPAPAFLSPVLSCPKLLQNPNVLFCSSYHHQRQVCHGCWRKSERRREQATERWIVVVG